MRAPRRKHEPTRARPGDFVALPKLRQCGARNQEAATITSSEWLGPRCHHRLPAVLKNGDNTASRSGSVPNNAPHASARFPKRLPSIISPTAAPSAACVIESTAGPCRNFLIRKPESLRVRSYDTRFLLGNDPRPGMIRDMDWKCV